MWKSDEEFSERGEVMEKSKREGKPPSLYNKTPPSQRMP
jgi:hypothetical protein